MARLILAGLLLASIGNAAAQSSGGMEQRLRAQLQALRDNHGKATLSEIEGAK